MFPGLATAQALRARGHDVSLWTGGKRIEDSTRKQWDGPVVTVPAEGISGHPLRLPRTLWVLARVYRRCVRELRAARPAALLAMGSYSSVGPVLAARRLGIPVILHEANVIPGRAIEWLAPLASAVAISFEETRRHLKHRMIVLTGIPLRPAVAQAAPTAEPPAVFTVLVMGGSQGAQRLNRAVPQALAQLVNSGVPLRVIHLAGERDRHEVEMAYQAAGVSAVVHGFLQDMPSAYRSASLAICRSGAASCAELAAFGIPAVLIPFPEAARNHQHANALAMQASGSARLVEQKDATGERLAAIVGALAADTRACEAMRVAARARALPSADAKLADLVERMASTR